MNQLHILVVEDEASIAELLELNLKLEGYQVTVVGDGKDVMAAALDHSVDLVCLDVMLPSIDGLSLCKMIKEKRADLPVLFLSAKGSAENRIEGLRSGGDDYLPKPFELEEFLLRVELLLKRSGALTAQYNINGRLIDFSSFEVKHGDQLSSLSQKECELLKLLVDRVNKVVSRDELIESVWGVDAYPSTRTIDNFILTFRKLFETDPKQPLLFTSVRGVGYMLKIDKS